MEIEETTPKWKVLFSRTLPNLPNRKNTTLELQQLSVYTEHSQRIHGAFSANAQNTVTQLWHLLGSLLVAVPVNTTAPSEVSEVLSQQGRLLSSREGGASTGSHQVVISSTRALGKRMACEPWAALWSWDAVLVLFPML